MLSFRRFVSCQAGSTLLLMALMLPMLMVVVGVAIDLGRLYAVYNRAQNASDAALLGAVATKDSIPMADYVDAEGIAHEGEVEKLFDANLPANYLGAEVSTLTTSNPSLGIFTTTFTVTVPSPVIGAFTGHADASMNLSMLSQVTVGYAKADTQGLELALVLDNTGSMASTIDASGVSKIDALKSAATNLVGVIFGADATLPNVHVSVIPYDIAVQIGTNRADWMQSDLLPPPTYMGITTSPPSQSSLDKYNTILAAGGSLDVTSSSPCPWGNCYATPKGFAMNRAGDVLCGPYIWYNEYDTPPVVCPDPIPTTCSDQNVCTPPNPETGDPGSCSIQTVCTPTCIPDPGGHHKDPGWWTFCADNGSIDADDTPPTAGEKWKFRLPHENSNHEIPLDAFLPQGATAPPPWFEDQSKWPFYLAPLQFGMSAEADITAALNAMTTSGDTRINVGLMWGWFTLSPKWQGLWDPGQPGLPAPFDPKNLNKTLVLMTDGQNIFTPGGDPYFRIPLADGSINDDDAKTLALCDAIKAEGITIYTIGLGNPGTGPNDINQSLLMACASRPEYFFIAPTVAELQTAFHQIGDQIIQTTIRLSE